MNSLDLQALIETRYNVYLYWDHRRAISYLKQLLILSRELLRVCTRNALHSFQIGLNMLIDALFGIFCRDEAVLEKSCVTARKVASSTRNSETQQDVKFQCEYEEFDEME